MSLEAGDTLGGCEILSELGEGGMGTVYRARQTSLGREVAIKVMQEAAATADSEARFIRETRIHVTLEHPCVVRVYASGSDAGRDYLVMELVRGRALEDVIDAEAPMDVQVAALIALDVVDALTYLHAKGIVHRDLKPRNVFLTEDRRAKVGDFGLAWSDGATVLTRQGAMVGTVKYMAPETILGADPGAPADLYALGVFLYRMVTGALPYEGTSTSDWLQRICNAVPPRAKTVRPDVPPELDDLLAKLLAKRPAERATAAEARAVLAGLLGEAAPPPPARVTKKVTRKVISVVTATPVAPPRASLAGPALAAALGAAITFGAGSLARAPASSGEAPAPPSVAAPRATASRRVPVVAYPKGPKDAYAELERTLTGKPLEAGRGGVGFLVTDPARVTAVAIEPQRELTPLQLHPGWNILEWPGADLAQVKVTLQVETEPPPVAAVVPELPASHLAHQKEIFRLMGGGLSVTDAEKMARKLLTDLPGDPAAQRLVGVVLVVLARHRREIEKDKASDLFLGTAGVLALGQRTQTELAGEGLGWLFRAIDREPRDAKAWAYAGTGFAVLNRFDLADEAHAHAVRIGPDDFWTWYQAYEIYEMARVDGRADEARRQRTVAALKNAEKLASRDTEKRQVAGALNQLGRAKAAY